MKRCMFWVLFLVVIYGCSGGTQSSTSIPSTNIVSNPSQPIVNVSDPQNDKTTVMGKVINPSNNNPYSQTEIQLAPVIRNEKNEAAFVLDVGRSPSTFTRDDGSFALENIPAQEYVIVVGDVYGAYKILLGDDQVTRVINPEVGKKLDLGTIEVDIFKP